MNIQEGEARLLHKTAEQAQAVTLEWIIEAAASTLRLAAGMTAAVVWMCVLAKMLLQNA